MPLGEFELIGRYFRSVALETPGSSEHITLGIGDDAALIAPAAGKQLVVSTDTLVLGTHFPPDYLPSNLAYRALAAATSDLAAMGARPLGFTLALTLPEVNESWLQSFAEGLTDAARDHRISLIGGDTTRGPLNINVTVFGEVRARNVVRRGDAQPGDLLCVGGPLGDGGGGLAVAVDTELPAGLSAAAREYLFQRFWRPLAQCELGLELAGVASAGLDISDGLIADARHLAEASGLALHIRVADLPRSDALRAWPQEKQREWMLGGGDDYVLLFTLPVASAGCLQVWASQGFQVAVIGEAAAGSGIWLDEGRGLEEVTRPAGYQHFHGSSNV